MTFPALKRFAALAALTLVAAACEDESPMEVQEPSIVEVATSAGSFNTLIAALDVAGLTSTLEGEGPFTVFAPTDAAFEALPDGAVDALLADTDLLARVLTYHVVPGRVDAAQVVGLDAASTVNGKQLAISVEGGSVYVDGAMVIDTDIEARNGIIHVIDDVLLPEIVLDLVQTAQKAGSFSTLLAALDATSLDDVLRGEGPFTVFAPTDDAFAALPAGTLEALLADPETLSSILLYHVLPGAVTSDQVVGLAEAQTANGASVSISIDGGAVMVDDATVVAVDITATNGVIHVIDQVILPPM